jgi:hypothetical protein
MEDQSMAEMTLWDIAYAWSLALSMHEQWVHFNVAFFHPIMAKGCFGWSFGNSGEAKS